MQNIKWKETLTLIFLNISVVISWIAYNEYQPILLDNFGISNLFEVTVIAKAIILILVPPIAGYLADKIISKNKGSFLVYTIGISITAITFMSVAVIIGAGPLSAISGLLPIMVVIWLIAMNLFNSPAVSLIDKFAPENKLPIVAAVLFGVTELFYALEPVVVELVQFFGDLLTFVVGFILITVSGFLFKKVSKDEIQERTDELKIHKGQPVTWKTIIFVLLIGTIGGLANATIIEYLPDNLNFESFNANFVSLILLGVAALISIPFAFFLVKKDLRLFLFPALVITIVAAILTMKIDGNTFKLIFASILTICYVIVSVTGLPFIIKSIDKKWVALAVGLYFGASEIFSGFFEVSEIS